MMKQYWEKVHRYYEYNGAKATIKAVMRKLRETCFPSLQKTSAEYKKFVETQKNFDRNGSAKEEGILEKTGKRIFIFGTVPYFDVGGGQRSAQFAKIFNRMGYSVYYIYAYACSEENIPMLSIPTTYHKYIGNVSYEELSSYARKEDIFIFEAPIQTFEKFLALAKLKKCKVVYENIDNWETSLGSMFFSRETLETMIREADMIVSTAKKLVEQTQKYVKEFCEEPKEVYYLANAVDEALFDPRKTYEKPQDFVEGEKTLLYYGSLWGEWFDWDIIKTIATQKASYAINLIGDASAIPHIVEKMPKNVHFLGIKKQEALPAYLQYTDFAMLPFKPGKIGDYVSPLKIFEYISMEKKILATKLPDVVGYPNLYAGNTAEEWLEEIQKERTTVDTGNFIAQNNWYSRCSKILEVLFPETAEKIAGNSYQNLSVIILNYNNKKVITRCVDTLLQFQKRYQYQIVVVDNGSTDGSYEVLQTEYAGKITLARNQKNGCSSGRNLGVEKATGDYIVFLDSDEWVQHEYWLDTYVQLLDTHEEIGAIGWGAGWFNSKGLSYKVVDAFEFKYMPPNAIARSDIAYLATCGFIMKKELFQKLGGFDLAYDPTCYEDTDLSLQIRNAGKEIYYSSYLGVGHLPHQTTKSGSSSHDARMKEKGAYFLKKWTEKNKDLIFHYVK